MKKILIGTHNNGKFNEISYLLSKKIKKISPIKLKIKSPKETGKTFSSNARLKAKYFSKFITHTLHLNSFKQGLFNLVFITRISMNNKPF